jgi:hypothetical protein
MYTFVIVTTADPTRPGLSFKVELPEFAYENWFKNNLVVAEALQKGFITERYNTSITVIDSENLVDTKKYWFEWSTLNNLLLEADFQTGYDTERKPGRPEKKVLVMTTSKERRTSALVARQGF